MRINPIEARISTATQPGTRRVTHPIGAEGTFANVGIYPTGIDLCQRTVVLLPVTTVRWRLRIRNYQSLTATARTGPINLNSVWLGEPTFPASDRWQGLYTSTPTQVYGQADLPSDGSEWTSDWITATASQFQAHTPAQLSFGITSNGQAIDVGYDKRGAHMFFGAGAAAQAGIAGQPTGSVFYLMFFDIRVEYEYAARANNNTPIVLAIGDSITSGYTTNSLAGTEGTMPHEAWIATAGLHHGYAVVNLAMGSAQMSSYATFTGHKITRADLTTTIPDFAVVALGSNDISPTVGNITNAATLKTNMTTVINNIRTLGIKRYGYATVDPAGFTGTNETARTTFNNWLRQLPLGAQFCWDHDKALRLEATPATPDADLVPTAPHPSLGGHQAKAAISALPRLF